MRNLRDFAANNSVFKIACELAKTPACRRQASKWFQKRGKAYEQRHAVAKELQFATLPSKELQEALTDGAPIILVKEGPNVRQQLENIKIKQWGHVGRPGQTIAVFRRTSDLYQFGAETQSYSLDLAIERATNELKKTG